jgi:transcriptional regulator with XRE-family HTH domain
MSDITQEIKVLPPTEREAEDARKALAAQEFAREIVRLRELAGISQKRLGALVGIEQALISRIELANYGISLDLVFRLAKAFNDNPHRLADIYWGIDSTSYNTADKELINNIWSLMLNYFQPGPNSPARNNLTPITQQDAPLTPAELEEVARMDQHHINQTRRKKQPIENKPDFKDNES